MTVNERLFLCGVIDKFTAVAQERKREEMIAILRGVAMTDEQATQTTDAILKNPRMYGA